MLPKINYMRRHKQTRQLSKPNRGRHHPDYEYGYLDEKNEFHLIMGAPSPKKASVQIVRNSVSGTSELSEIEKVVENAVKARLRVARDAAMKTFSQELGV